MTQEPYDEDDDDFLESDPFHDAAGMALLKTELKIPEKWYLIKILNYDAGNLSDMKGWCKKNCKGKYKMVGWAIACSDKHGVAMENISDATFFKLRFS